MILTVFVNMLPSAPSVISEHSPAFEAALATSAGRAFVTLGSTVYVPDLVSATWPMYLLRELNSYFSKRSANSGP